MCLCLLARSFFMLAALNLSHLSWHLLTVFTHSVWDILVLGVMCNFQLKPEHFGSYVTRPWILFKSCFCGHLWLLWGMMEMPHHYWEVGWKSRFSAPPLLTRVKAGFLGSLSSPSYGDGHDSPLRPLWHHPQQLEIKVPFPICVSSHIVRGGVWGSCC